MRNAIVTGAGSGIGRAIAGRLAREGYNVIVNDMRAGGCRAGRARDRRQGASPSPAMFRRRPMRRSCMAACEKAFGACTHLVNNAGHVHQARFVDLQPADFDRMFAVHVRGTYLCMRAVLPGMLARKSGVIVNIASQLGQIGGIGPRSLFGRQGGDHRHDQGAGARGQCAMACASMPWRRAPSTRRS